MGWIASLLSLAFSAAEEHPDITKALWQEVAGIIGVHASKPHSDEARAALHAGLAAAASSAVTTVIERMKTQPQAK